MHQYFVPYTWKVMLGYKSSCSVTDATTWNIHLVNAQMRFFFLFDLVLGESVDTLAKKIEKSVFLCSVWALWPKEPVIMEFVWKFFETLTYVIKFSILFLMFFTICLNTSFNVFSILQSNMVFGPFLFSFPSWLFFRFLAVLKFCFTSADDACLAIFFFQFASSSCAVVCVHADISQSCFIALVSMPEAVHHSHRDPIPPPCPPPHIPKLIEWVILR